MPELSGGLRRCLRKIVANCEFENEGGLVAELSSPLARLWLAVNLMRLYMPVTKCAHQYPTQDNDLGVQLQSIIGFHFLAGPPPDSHGMGPPWETTRHKLIRMVGVPPIIPFTRMLIKNCCTICTTLWEHLIEILVVLEEQKT